MFSSGRLCTFCWSKYTDFYLRGVISREFLRLSGKAEVGARKYSALEVRCGDRAGHGRAFSTSTIFQARGNRVRPTPLPEEPDYENFNPIVEDFPDMKHRQATPKVIKRLSAEGVDMKDLVENSTNLAEGMPDSATEEDKWSSSPYPHSEGYKRERDQAKKVARPKIDPKLTSVVLFPGQGAQFVGMGSKLLSYPNVREIYDVAGEILGYNLLGLCLNGPLEDLNKTVYSQTAIYTTSVAALEKLKAQHPLAVESCIATAGFSVGEYAALVFAGSISFEDGLRLVKARAEAMQTASEVTRSGMMSVMMEHNSQLTKALEVARLWCQEKKKIPDPVCKIANYLFPEMKIIAGHSEALDFLEANAAQFGIRPLKRLAVSGAFHTPLMSPAKEDFFRPLSTVKFKQPTIKVHSNVSGTAYYSCNSIPKVLLKQMDSPVKWEQTLHCIYEREQGVDFPATYEVGPGRQLGAILKRTNAKAYARYSAVDV